MRWEDIENDQQQDAGGVNDGNNEDPQNSFVPQQLMDNVRDKPNNQNTNAQSQNPINNSTQALSQTQNLDQINENNTIINHNNNNENNHFAHNFEEIPQEIMENDDMNEMEIPAEVMNAPDVDIYDDDMDLEFYDLERDKKRVKSQ